VTEILENLDCYLVGGAVRDELLGLNPDEKDWVVIGSTAMEMKSLGFKQVGKDFPVFLHPQTGEEYALARMERKTSPGHTGFEFDTGIEISLEEDLNRRDLTINSIAKSKTGQLIDPFNGQSDLHHRVLRHTSNAFVEDPLRVLRVARFKAQLSPFNFSIEQSTIELMKELVECGEVSTLSADRIWKETEKALLTSRPSLYFETLRQCGALKIIFPQIDALFGVPQRPEYHPEIDSGIHTMMVVDRAAELTEDLAVRFAALIHDLGKALTPLSQLPSHVGHEKRGLKPLKQITQKYPIPNKIRKLAQLSCEHHLLMHRFFELRPQTIYKLIERLDGFRRPEHVEQFALLCQADSQGRGNDRDKPYPQFQLFNNIFDAVRNISVKDTELSTMDGPEIGKAIKSIRIAKISDMMKNYVPITEP